MSDGFAYPKRPKFFAHKFCRVLWKSCAANEIGADACWLLVGIAMTEDARGYRSPVTYFNEQLYPVAGQQNVKAMVRARDRAVAAGWLAYQPGGKGVAGKYFVTLPPEHGDWDDLPTDEGAVSLTDTTSILSKETGEKREGSGVRSGKEVGSQTGEKREGSGQHSSLFLPPIPIPNPNTPQPPATAGGEAAETKPARPTRERKPKAPPKPREPDPLFDAVAEVTGSDPTVAGSHVTKVRHSLANANPPFTPEHVREFGARFGEFCPWGPEKGRLRPTLGELEKNIGLLRAAPPPPPRPQPQRSHADPLPEAIRAQILALDAPYRKPASPPADPTSPLASAEAAA